MDALRIHLGVAPSPGWARLRTGAHRLTALAIFWLMLLWMYGAALPAHLKRDALVRKGERYPCCKTRCILPRCLARGVLAGTTPALARAAARPADAARRLRSQCCSARGWRTRPRRGHVARRRRDTRRCGRGRVTVPAHEHARHRGRGRARARLSRDRPARAAAVHRRGLRRRDASRPGSAVRRSVPGEAGRAGAGGGVDAARAAHAHPRVDEPGDTSSARRRRSPPAVPKRLAIPRRSLPSDRKAMARKQKRASAFAHEAGGASSGDRHLHAGGDGCKGGGDRRSARAGSNRIGGTGWLYAPTGPQVYYAHWIDTRSGAVTWSPPARLGSSATHTRPHHAAAPDFA